MKTMQALLSLALTMGIGSSLQAQQSSGTPRFAAGMQFGYRDGASVDVTITAMDFASGFELPLRFGLAYASVEPGVALDARRIFINNATNGIPEEAGKTIGARLDVLVPVSILSLPRAYAFGGVRHARFSGNFKFIGGNEDFDIRSNQWGLGGGVESYFGISRRVDMVFTAGLDHFFSSTLSGHDTSYSPDGEDVNPREDYTYSDADAAVGQPKLEPAILLGLSYRF
jgi:hypothetical protein